MCGSAAVPHSPNRSHSQDLHSLYTQSSQSSSAPSHHDAEQLPFIATDASPCPHPSSPLPAPTATFSDTAGLEPLQQPAAACLAPERAESSSPDAHITARKDGPQEQQACYLCMDRRADAILVECCHGGLCGVCAAALWRSAATAPGAERRCPLCRLPFVGVMLIVGEAAGTVRA